jgi:putative transposase
LEHVAQKKDKQVVFVDRWYPSSKTCSHCGHVLDKLDLSERRWRCPSCHAENDRDTNASINIKRVGISTLGLGDVRQAELAIPA